MKKLISSLMIFLLLGGVFSLWAASSSLTFADVKLMQQEFRKEASAVAFSQERRLVYEKNVERLSVHCPAIKEAQAALKAVCSYRYDASLGHEVAISNLRKVFREIKEKKDLLNVLYEEAKQMILAMPIEDA